MLLSRHPSHHLRPWTAGSGRSEETNHSVSSQTSQAAGLGNLLFFIRQLGFSKSTRPASLPPDLLDSQHHSAAMETCAGDKPPPVPDAIRAARIFLREFYSERWGDKNLHVQIECDLTMNEVRRLGYLNKEDGTRACRRLIQVAVLNDEVGHTLWTELAEAVRGKNVFQDIEAAKQARAEKQVAEFLRRHKELRNWPPEAEAEAEAEAESESEPMETNKGDRSKRQSAPAALPGESERRRSLSKRLAGVLPWRRTST